MPECLRKIMEQARKLAPIAVVVVDAAEEHVLTGAHEAAQAGLIEPILIGRRRDIEAICERPGFVRNTCPIIETESDDVFSGGQSRLP